MRTTLCLSSLLLLAAPAAAQLAAGNVNDGNVRLGAGAFPTSISSANTGINEFRVNGTTGTDHLYQHWWYWRLDTDTREYALHNDTTTQAPPVSTYVGNKMTFVWPNVDNRNFSAVLEAQAFTTGPTSGMVVEKMTFTNNTGAGVNLNLFAYIDYDQCGATSNSAVANPTTNQQAITGTTCSIPGEAFAIGADNYQVTPFATVRGTLLNAAADNLPNTGLPFGPGDYTSAWQWKDRAVPNGGSLVVYFVLGGGANHSGCLQPAAALPYFTAKAGTNGLPSFDASVLPFLGRSANLTINNGFAGSAPFFLFGAQRANIPFPPFGTIYVNPVGAVQFTGNPFDGTNTSTIGIAIPNNNALCNGVVAIQAFWLDPGAAGSIAHTEGMVWNMGGVF